MARKTDTHNTSSSNTTMQANKGPSTMNDDQVRKQIAESAYYRAQQRGFAGGNPVEDWLTAEREITGQKRGR